MIPADYTPLARRAYEGSTFRDGPWEDLPNGRKAKWVKVIAHLATPPAERASISQRRLQAEKRAANERMAA